MQKKPDIQDEFSPALKRLLSQWSQLKLNDGILCRTFYNDLGTVNQQIVPNDIKLDIMKSLHDDVGGGHLGVKKMSSKIRDRFYWVGWQMMWNYIAKNV